MIKEFYQYWVISRSGIFDRNYYLLEYPDVRTEDINPLWHFVRYGWKEGKNPTKYFDTNYYQENNPDVKIKGINPLVHYIKHGLKEGRKPRPEICGNKFDDNSEFNIPNPVKLLDTSANIFRDEVNQIKTKVSVVIPTKNAGKDFEFLLKMLRSQVGIKEIEIVIVDSGSEDETVLTAKNYSAKVISIPPEKFSHSYSRNVGVQNASGDYLLFTVQDALPPTSTWLYELLSILINNDVSAVSCAETPREDADLFYRVISWNHYNFLGVNNNDKIFKMPANPDHISLRQNGQLSDLACLISRELFEKYHFKLNYAEDLDLGIRLIKDGHKIAFLSSTRIIHSHNRSAFYFLKRGYVDNLFLTNVFSDFKIPKVKLEELVPAIIFTFNFLNHEVNGNLTKLELPAKTEEIIACIEESINSKGKFKSPPTISEQGNDYIDNQAVNFIKDLVDINSQVKIDNKQSDILLLPLLGYFVITYNYLRNTYEIIDLPLIKEIKCCLFKDFSILVGSYLAYCYLSGSEREQESFLKFHTLLIDGV